MFFYSFDIWPSSLIFLCKILSKYVHKHMINVLKYILKGILNRRREPEIFLTKYLRFLDGGFFEQDDFCNLYMMSGYNAVH